MHTRIREFRKRRGMTLQQLAEIVGTTPQTVQRLETANMTVSMEWLERFAGAFSIPVSSLIADGRAGSVRLLGKLGRGGILHAGAGSETDQPMALEVPADDPVAVHLETDVGGYAQGSYLIGNRLALSDLANAHGQDCIVQLASGVIVLRRLLVADGAITLIPIEPSGDVRFNADIEWAARLVMQVRYL